MSGQSVRNEDSQRKSHRGSARWDQDVGRYLVGCAARKAPPGLRERLEEEWRADLMARQGAFARIRFGLGCCWATRVIAREFGAAAAATAGAASGQRLLIGHGGYDLSRLSRRTTAMIAIVCLHAAVFYAYLSGLAQRVLVEPVRSMGTTFITQPQRPHTPPPLPPPTFTHTIVEVPTPLAPIPFPAHPTAITAVGTPHPSAASANLTPAEPVKRVIGGPGAGFPDTGDFYPPAARRLGEAGATVVSVCVDPRGALTAAPTILQSSGIGRIDQGALRLAQAGSGHYRPTTENGRPVSACYAFRIRFQLEDQ